MKNFTLSLGALLLTTTLSAQETNNAVTDGNFSQVVTSSCVDAKDGKPDLMRIAKYWALKNEIANPTAAAADLNSGQWYKRASNTGYLRATALQEEGNTFINLFIKAGSPVGGDGNFEKGLYLVQPLAQPLDMTSQYEVTFRAKVSDIEANPLNNRLALALVDVANMPIENQVVASDLTLRGDTLDLTTEWATYSYTFNLPKWAAREEGTVVIDGSKVALSFCMTSHYDEKGKSTLGSIAIDDVVLAKVTDTSIDKTSQKSLVYVVKNQEIQLRHLKPGDLVEIYEISGRQLVAQTVNSSTAVFSLPKGYCIVKVGGQQEKIYIH